MNQRGFSLPELLTAVGLFGILAIMTMLLMTRGLEHWRHRSGGQTVALSLASASRRFEAELPIAGLAKEQEEFFLPGQSESILLPRDSQALYLVQRVRDEAHRFAITYHRQKRSKATFQSRLDDIPGVGPKRKKAMLKAFGSLKGIREASIEDLAKVEGVNQTLAEQIKSSLGG